MIVCGTIIHREAAAAKCSAIDLLIFVNLFWMFYEIPGPLNPAAQTERSTIYQKMSKISNPPLEI